MYHTGYPTAEVKREMREKGSLKLQPVLKPSTQGRGKGATKTLRATQAPSCSSHRQQLLSAGTEEFIAAMTGISHSFGVSYMRGRHSRGTTLKPCHDCPTYSSSNTPPATVQRSL